MQKPVIFLVALTLGACQGQQDKVPQKPQIEVDQNPILLKVSFVGTSQNAAIQVFNRGRESMHLSSVAIASDQRKAFSAPDFVGSGEPNPNEIAGLKAGFIRFSYSAPSAGRDTGLLQIQSDAENQPSLAVPIKACAVSPDGGVCDFPQPDGGI